MDGKSSDIAQDKLNKLKELFPEIFVEGKVDVEKLKLTIGENLNVNNERYVLNWAGKADAFKVLQTPTTATLIPIPEESISFDKTNHVFIEGENLDVLKVLQKSYYGKIKMIYIDPPYNTGNDNFIYPDRFSESKEEYLKRIGEKDEDGYLVKEGLFRKNSKENGQFHSNWLSMMYPRLFLARNLLREDGVMFVSIDDNEVHSLRLLMNEVFGEENFVANICLLCNPRGRALDKYFATNHEYVIVYSKNQLSKGSFSIEKEMEQIENEYPEEDDSGKYRLLELRNTHREYGKHNRKNLYYPFYVNETTDEISLIKGENPITVLPNWDDGYEGCWTWDKHKASVDIELLVAKKVNGNYKIYRKSYANGADRMIKTILNDRNYQTEKGQKAFNKLFESKSKIFQSPKSVELIKLLLSTTTKQDDMVLDFFSGSCTTAHAVLALNKEDGGNRKFICVQLAEKTSEDSEAFKAGYKTIADISKERIRRVIKKLKDEGMGKAEGSIGFKVFKLKSSSFKIWRSDVIENGDELGKQLDAFENPVKPEVENINMMWEILFKTGYDFNTQIDKMHVNGSSYYSIEGNELIIILGAITEPLVKAIVKSKPRKCICLDNLFAGNDQLKTNTVLQMKDAGIEFKTI